jgi:two-component system, response regulator YesN
MMIGAQVMPMGVEVMNEQAFRYYAGLARLKLYVERNISTPLTAREAASIAGMSPGYFSTFFHDRVGVRFTAWLRGLRVEVAKAIIRESDVSISDVATQVGFNDLRTFERAFKVTARSTPRQYKQSVRPGARRR